MRETGTVRRPTWALVGRLSALKQAQEAGEDVTKALAELTPALAACGYARIATADEDDEHGPGRGCDEPEDGWTDWPPSPQRIAESDQATLAVVARVAEDAAADPVRRAKAITSYSRLRTYVGSRRIDAKRDAVT